MKALPSWKLETETRADVRDFCDYLTDTLIPDLREAGRNSTADDFEQSVKYMREGWGL